MKLTGILGDPGRVRQFEIREEGESSKADSKARETAVEGLQMLDFFEQLDGSKHDRDERPGKVVLDNAPTGVGGGTISAVWEKVDGRARARAVLTDQGTSDYYNMDGKVIERATVGADGAAHDAQKLSVRVGPSSEGSGLAYQVSYLEGGQAVLADEPFQTGGLDARIFNTEGSYGFPVETEVAKQEQESVKALFADKVGLADSDVSFIGGYVQTHASSALDFRFKERLGAFTAPTTARTLVFEDRANQESYAVRTPNFAEPLTSLEGALIGKWQSGQEQPAILQSLFT